MAGDDAARAWLAAVVESTDDAIITKTLDGTITSWNPAAERIFGYRATEVVGRHISIIIPLDRRAEEDEIIRRLSRGERVDHFETIRQAKDGRLIDISITISPIMDKAGRVLGASKIARDISDRRVDERRRRFLTDSTTAFSLSLDLDSTIRSIVRSAVPALGDFACLDLITAEDRLERKACLHAVKQGADFDEILRYAPPRHSLTHPAARALSMGRPVHIAQPDNAWRSAFEVPEEHARFLARQGARSILALPLCARGKMLGVLSLFMADSGRGHAKEDIALAEEYARVAAEALENALLYRDAQAAISEREKFISIASHELRTPLTTMQLQLQLARRTLVKQESGAPEKAGEQIARAEEQGFRIARLVNDLLDISRITAGKMKLQIEYFDLADLVRSVAEQFGAELADRKIDFEIRAPHPARGRWDRFRMEQVVANLVSNAIRYGDGKPVRIGLEAKGDDIRLTVEDQGRGMEAEFVKRVFKPFEQAEPGSPKGGLGLGLFIARQIVEAHGGRISVTSTPGSGSSFTVVLPREFSTEKGDRNEEDPARR